MHKEDYDDSLSYYDDSYFQDIFQCLKCAGKAEECKGCILEGSLDNVFKLKMSNGFYSIVEVRFDKYEKILHLLDLNIEETMTLTNAIDDFYLNKILTYFNFENVEKIFLYHTDETVSEWVGGFKFIDFENNKLCNNDYIKYIKKYANKRVKL